VKGIYFNEAHLSLKVIILEIKAKHLFPSGTNLQRRALVISGAFLKRHKLFMADRADIQ
jgi:hypothetical protein